MCTHNYCDTCGYTKEKVFVTEIWMEAGLIQCVNCYNKTFKSEQWKEYYAYLDGINGLPQSMITLKSLVMCLWTIELQVIPLVKDVK